MSEHLGGEAMNSYARRALTPGDLLAADDHLEACLVCRERISDEAGLKEAVRSLQIALQPAGGGEAGHLSYEQLEAHAEGILARADREIIDTHLGGCELCAFEARDFAAFARLARASIAASIGAGAIGPQAGGEKKPADASQRAAPQAIAQREIREAQPAEPSAEADESEPAPEVARRFPGPALLVVLAAGLVAAVAAAWLVPAWLRGQVGDLTAEVEALRKANEALSLQAQQAESLRAELERVQSEAADGLPAGQETTAPELGAPSMAVTLTDRRGPVGLDANGDLIGLDALPVEAGRAIAAALRSRRVETPAELQDLIVASVAPEAETAAGAAARPLTPVATMVRDPRPTFSWQARPGAARYHVEVYDAELNPVARSESLSRTSWRPSRPLTRGGVHLWQVIARRGGEEMPPLPTSAPEARFKILGAAESAALERLLRDSGGSRLAAGVLLARAGCVDEARKELRELLQQNPGSPVARALLTSLEDGGDIAAGTGGPPR